MQTSTRFTTALITTALIAAIAFAGAAFAANDLHQAGDDHRPQHGGVVTATKRMDYELVARPGTIHLYLRDHGKPASVTNAGARLTLLNGAAKQEVELKPAGDKLAATGAFKVGPGTKAVATVTIDGKPVGNARFILK